MASVNSIVITGINTSPSGEGIQFNLHVLDEEHNFVLTIEDLLAALNVRK